MHTFLHLNINTIYMQFCKSKYDIHSGRYRPGPNFFPLSEPLPSFRDRKIFTEMGGSLPRWEDPYRDGKILTEMGRPKHNIHTSDEDKRIRAYPLVFSGAPIRFCLSWNPNSRATSFESHNFKCRTQTLS